MTRRDTFWLWPIKDMIYIDAYIDFLVGSRYADEDAENPSSRKWRALTCPRVGSVADYRLPAIGSVYREGEKVKYYSEAFGRESWQPCANEVPRHLGCRRTEVVSWVWVWITRINADRDCLMFSWAMRSCIFCFWSRKWFVMLIYSEGWGWWTLKRALPIGSLINISASLKVVAFFVWAFSFHLPSPIQCPKFLTVSLDQPS